MHEAALAVASGGLIMYDNVYGAVIIRVIARVHPVHLMNVERRQAAADPRPSQTT